MRKRGPGVTPIPPAILPANDPTLTVDRFIAEVPLDPHRSILVFRRQHGGRTFIRWRVFHKHRKGGNWYPDKRRSFVIPIDAGNALASALAAAQRGKECTAKPGWLAEVDHWRRRRLRKMRYWHAPPDVLESEMRKNSRAYGMPRRRNSAERARKREEKLAALMKKVGPILERFREATQ